MDFHTSENAMMASCNARRISRFLETFRSNEASTICDEQHVHCSEKKFSIKDFFSKFDQIRSFLHIWSDLLKKSLMGNFIFYAMMSETVSLSVPQRWPWGNQVPVKKILQKILYKSLEGKLTKGFHDSFQGIVWGLHRNFWGFWN